eukprot:TRINITY_DN3376_c1_g1_i1.p1 TRINITY_DN3376_c1_g1~~TRINITY_DN3376_c1_g1_i1.p1  ORF type:complete len:477 (+),score=91.42 TRINITY_DN3376_c1_g1_i1:141-1571(+)
MMSDLQERLDVAEQLQRMETEAMSAIAEYMREIARLSSSSARVLSNDADPISITTNGKSTNAKRKQQQQQQLHDEPVRNTTATETINATIKRLKTTSPPKDEVRYPRKEGESPTKFSSRLLLEHSKDDSKGVISAIVALKLNVKDFIDVITTCLEQKEEVPFDTLSELVLESGSCDDVLEILLDKYQRELVKEQPTQGIYHVFSNLAGLCCSLGRTCVCEVICYDAVCMLASLLVSDRPEPIHEPSVFKACMAAAAGVLSKYTVPYHRSWVFCAHLVVSELSESETEIVKVYTTGCEVYLMELCGSLFLPDLVTDYASIKTRVLGRLLGKRTKECIKTDAILTMGLCGVRFGFDFCQETKNSKLVSDIVDVMCCKGELDEGSVTVLKMLSYLYLMVVRSSPQLPPPQKEEISTITLSILQHCKDYSVCNTALLAYHAVTEQDSLKLPNAAVKAIERIRSRDKHPWLLDLFANLEPQ